MAIPPVGGAVAGGAAGGIGLGTISQGVGVASGIKSLLGLGGSSTPATSSARSTNLDEKVVIVSPSISFGEFLTGPASNGGFGLPPSRIIPAAFQSPENSRLASQAGGFTGFDFLLLAGVAGVGLWWYLKRR